MSKHTPGPWRWENWPSAVDDREGDALLGKGGYGVIWCDKANSPCSTNQANARLIAAAPELLEALELIAKDAPTEEPEIYYGDNHGDSYANGGDRATFNLAQIARAAIARAKGEKP